MSEADQKQSDSPLHTLDDASLFWLESLSLDNVAPEVRHRWQGLLEPGPSPAHRHTPINGATAPSPRPVGQELPLNDSTEPSPRPIGQELPQSEGIKALIRAYRRYGHRAANLDPLALQPPPQVPELDPATYGLGDVDPATPVSPEDTALKGPVPFGTLLDMLRQTYCGTLAVETHQADSSPRDKWLLEKLETRISDNIPHPVEEKLELLRRLTAAVELENYLGRRYPGAKRFGLEGAESLIPLLDGLIDRAADEGAQEICIGMAHRGRLNVLANVFGKPTQELFAEFDGTFVPATETGDVKYHQGLSSDIRLANGQHVHLAMSFNPSHLEAVGPVLEGSVRARQDRRNQQGSDGRREVVGILLHGDAALSGQGVVMETLQMSATPAYSTGGTVHVVVNNQIGFTTSNPEDARSTLYCTDISRMISAPVLHVNADDPEAVAFAAELCMEYRYHFGTDIFLDLVCFRRLGHNEADEPSVTQPLMYQAIREHQGVRELYARQLQREGRCDEATAAKMVEIYRKGLDAGAIVTHLEVTHTRTGQMFDWEPYLKASADDTVKTSVRPESIGELLPVLCEPPADFKLQRQVERTIAARREMLGGERPLDWGCAEMLAYSSLLKEGYPLRFSGQDCRRGTFTHRHAVLFDQQTGQEYAPLHLIAEQSGVMAGHYDSLLSEEAVLAFEYGYAATWPSGLVIWEAQFGDFANGAQVIIDQFIVSGEQKWNRLSGLVLLLPHGHEGQGPEHSSARLERFLQLCARQNIQVCAPSTPAQLFHLLRRQGHSSAAQATGGDDAQELAALAGFHFGSEGIHCRQVSSQ